MFYEDHIRETLISACHSSNEADNFFRLHLDNPKLLALLVHIAKDDKDYGGDAPMTAAYYVSEFPPQMLEQHEQTLREMLPTIDGYGGHVALALGKTRSPAGRQVIIEQLGDGTRIDAHLFRRALSEYDQTPSA
jgi:hypothetical protein